MIQMEHKRQSYPGNILSGGMVRKAINATNFRPWANLPDELLEMISMRLSFVDYFTFGHVCSSWRYVSIANREVFMATQPPFLVLVSLYAKRTCSLYNISDGRRYKTMLPNLNGMFFWGFSCGYLIMRDNRSKIWLVNLITKEELGFPKLPKCIVDISRSFCSILAYSTALSQFVMVFANRHHKHVHFCGVGDEDWASYSFLDERWMIVDLAFLDGNIYVLTNRGRLGVFKLRPRPALRLLDVGATPTVHSRDLKLVTSNGQLLLVVGFYSRRRIYKLDCNRNRMEWVKMENLGEGVLVINETQGYMVSSPSVWRGHINCIYSTVYNTGNLYLQFLDARPDRCLQFLEKDQTEYLKHLVWYFPRESHKRNLLQDEQ